MNQTLHKLGWSGSIHPHPTNQTHPKRASNKMLTKINLNNYLLHFALGFACPVVLTDDNMNALPIDPKGSNSCFYDILSYAILFDTGTRVVQAEYAEASI